MWLFCLTTASTHFHSVFIFHSCSLFFSLACIQPAFFYVLLILLYFHFHFHFCESERIFCICINIKETKVVCTHERWCEREVVGRGGEWERNECGIYKQKNKMNVTIWNDTLLQCFFQLNGLAHQFSALEIICTLQNRHSLTQWMIQWFNFGRNENQIKKINIASGKMPQIE